MSFTDTIEYLKKSAHPRILKFTTTFFTILLSSGTLFSQNFNEIGLYNIRNYSAKEYNLAPQNFAIVQDSRGVLFFGNNSDILEYDGQNWDTIQTPNEVTVRSLTIDSKGVVYVGAEGDIGYLAPDDKGRMHYHSLLNYIENKSQRDFGPVWTCYATKDNYVYFQSSTRIFRWDGKRIKTWETRQGSAFHLMFYLNGTIYVRENKAGMKKMVDSTLEFIQGGDLFAQSKIYFMQPFRKNEILLSNEGHGLFAMQPANFSARIQDAMQLTKISPFHTDIDQFFADNRIYNGILFNNKYYSIGTRDGGLVVIDSSGNLIGAINKKNGLQDEAINYQYIDSQQKLWLATNNGISKVDISSPITTFNDQNGLEGTVEAITRCGGKLYAATLNGTFCLSSLNSSQEGLIEQSHFNKLDGLATECWDLLSFNTAKQSLLIVASNDGIFQVDGNKVSLIAKGSANTMHRSIIDSNRIFIGWTVGGTTTNGLTSIYWNNGKWTDEGDVGEIPEDITSIAEENDGTIWCGHRKNGVIRIRPIYLNKKIDNVQVDRLPVIKGIQDESEESNIYVKNINGRIYYGTIVGLYKYNGNNTFSKDSSLGKQFCNGQLNIFRMNSGPDGSIWIVTISQVDGQKQVGYIVNPGKSSHEWITKPFMGISKSIVYAMYHDNNGITWLGGPDGITRYDRGIQKNYDKDFYTLIHKVIISKGKDSTIFFGAYSNDSGTVSVLQPDKLKLQLPYAFNSLIFTYAAPDFEDESSLLYSYRLEGSDAQHAQWSDWKNETKATYTYLPEGHYFFHVKAKNIFGHESLEAVYEFTILSPWYRTIWAYIAYVLFFVAFVYGAITVSNRSLRNIINERTAEVVKQKEVIELKNKDITDSINYAKRIQEAILPTLERFKFVLPESFILFKPKDIVSGDFYWMAEKNDMIFVAAGDCTGHGVPGAMVSVVCSNALNRAVKEFGITDPGLILDKVRDLVIETFEKSEKEDIKDGMDISLCAINTKTKEIKWSGANNPLWYIQGTEIKEITADKQPIGNSDNPKPFTTHSVKLHKGDEIYLFTDGYADQFGGPKGKKFKYKQLEQKVLEGRNLEMTRQQNNLNSAFESWKGGLDQVDDVLIIGIRV
ncbi:MAG: SpoIIE family protein phosphatase [Bacteroidia bacterium]